MCIGSKLAKLNMLIWSYVQFVYVTIGNPDFCLALYLTGVHFRGE